MRRASELLREAQPELEIDGEMHVLSALNPKLRKTIYSQSTLKGRANVLVMPNLDAANIAMGLIRSLTDALLIGPFINGFSKPAHIVIPSVSSRGIFNMTALDGCGYSAQQVDKVLALQRASSNELALFYIRLLF